MGPPVEVRDVQHSGHLPSAHAPTRGRTPARPHHTPARPRRQSALSVAIFNIIATVIGGGVLTLPYAMAKTGWLLGSVLLVRRPSDMPPLRTPALPPSPSHTQTLLTHPSTHACRLRVPQECLAAIPC